MQLSVLREVGLLVALNSKMQQIADARGISYSQVEAEFIDLYTARNPDGSFAHTYSWIIDFYWEKADAVVGYGTISNWVRRLELPKREVRHTALIPWELRPEHLRANPARLLRSVGRLRAGMKAGAAEQREATNWERWLNTPDPDADPPCPLGRVVHYDPDLEYWDEEHQELVRPGFIYLPRESTDTDIVRKPPHNTRKRR